MRARSLFAVGALSVLLGTASDAAAQCRIDLVESGIQAYRDLDLGAAADRFAEAVDANSPAQCGTENARALVYLGATHWLAERPDSAMRAFERAVVQAPRFRPDAVEFPPAVTDLYDRVRQETPAVAPTLPEEVEIGPSTPRQALAIRLNASIDHPVTVAVVAGGEAIRTVYEGVVEGDARGTVVEWNGQDQEGRPVETGWYDLEIVSRDEASRPVRKVVVALAVESDAPPGSDEPEMVEVIDTVRAPSEGGSAWKAVGVAGVGLLGGAAVVAVPYYLDGGTGGWGRYSIAGSLGLAGIVGFFKMLGGEEGEVTIERRLVPAETPPAPPPTLRIRPAYERRVELNPLNADTSGPGRVDGSGREAP